MRSVTVFVSLDFSLIISAELRAPIILILLEIVRFFQVGSFLNHLHAGRQDLPPAPMESLGKRHRRRSERRSRSRRSGVEESSEDEKALLSV